MNEIKIKRDSAGIEATAFVPVGLDCYLRYSVWRGQGGVIVGRCKRVKRVGGGLWSYSLFGEFKAGEWAWSDLGKPARFTEVKAREILSGLLAANAERDAALALSFSNADEWV
jgi:hypothetical protein